MKILFLSSSNFGALVLQNLAGISAEIVLVTSPDKLQGRGLKSAANPAKTVAQNAGLEFIEVNSKTHVAKVLAKSDYDLALIAGFSFIIPVEVLKSPKTGLKHLVLHPSLLPALRGASPIQTTLLKGLKKSGICLFEIESSVDSGRIIACEKLAIGNKDNYATLENKFAQIGAKMIISTWQKYLVGKVKAKDQSSQVSFTKQIEKSDGRINFKMSTARNIYNKFRAFYVWPGIYFEINSPSSSKKIKITDLDLVDGKLEIKKVVPEGKKEMDFKAFLNGYRFPLDLTDKIRYPS